MISFKNLSYTYPDTNITALKDVSFTINPGETLAIVGNTGSGKSTVLELIGRLYDVDDGQLLIDNTPIKDLNLDSLRSSIGYVPQDAFLFSDTLSNNIKFGKEDATQEEIVQAAKSAAVHRRKGALAKHVAGTPLHVSLTHLALGQHVAPTETLHLILQRPAET